MRKLRQDAVSTTHPQGFPRTHTPRDELRALLAQRWLPFVVLALSCAAVYANTLHNDFHLDDYYRVLDNPGIQQIRRPWLHFVDPHTMSTLSRILGYRPLLPLSLSINYALAGDSLPGYHIGNILLQLGAASLVYLLVLALLQQRAAPPLSESAQRGVALCVALLFAVHPVSGIPVNYICARDQLLCQLFWSASLLVYVRTAHSRRARDWANCLGLLCLALLAKGDAVAAPLVVLCLELTVYGRAWRKPGPWLRALPFALPVIGLLAFQSFVLGSSELDNVLNTEPTHAYAYPLTQARLHLFRYLPQFVWPFSIHQDPSVRLATRLTLRGACGVALVLGTVALAWRYRKREPLLAFCVLAYWAMLAPTSSFVPLLHLAVDYRPYPASPFLFLLVIAAAHRLRLPAKPLLAGAAVAWCAACSIYLNQTWRSELSLWNYSIARGGGALAHLNLAMSQDDPAVRRPLLERALELEPDYIVAKIDLGLALVASGDIEAGLARLAATTRDNPRHAQAHYWYAKALYKHGPARSALSAAVQAAVLDPRSTRAAYLAALAAQAADAHEVALHWLDVRQQLEPAEPELEFSRAFSLQKLDRLEQAIVAYRAFLRDQPAHVQARFNLGCALEALGQYKLAATELERVLALDPGRTAAHFHLAACSRALGNLELAQLHQSTWEATQSTRH